MFLPPQGEDQKIPSPSGGRSGWGWGDDEIRCRTKPIPTLALPLKGRETVFVSLEGETVFVPFWGGKLFLLPLKGREFLRSYFLFTGEAGSIRYATTWLICSGVRCPLDPSRGMFEHGEYAQAL